MAVPPRISMQSTKHNSIRFFHDYLNDYYTRGNADGNGTLSSELTWNHAAVYLG